ncbi:hypothetical protein I3843_14G033400 [Carya illinoinensis]|nr:hypothetical protein I3843_14G033400 [Carya illinoinensis]
MKLKTIVAGFLQGFSTKQKTQAEKLSVAPAEPSLEKNVDTFDQRTSIYCGFTRNFSSISVWWVVDGEMGLSEAELPFEWFALCLSCSSWPCMETLVW